MKKSTERRMNLGAVVIFGVQFLAVAFVLIFKAVHQHRNHRDLLATDALTLQFICSEEIRLQEPHAYAREGVLVVSGCLNRPAPAAGPAISQVDVEVLSAEGELLGRATVRELSRCRRGGEHFSTRFLTIPSDGSVLSIKAFTDSSDASRRGSSSPDAGG